jgi:hypothetical protein
VRWPAPSTVAAAFAAALVAAGAAAAATPPGDRALAHRLVLAKGDLVDGFAQIYEGDPGGATSGSTPDLPCPDSALAPGSTGGFGRGFLHRGAGVFLASSANVYASDAAARHAAALPQRVFGCLESHVPFTSTRTVGGAKQTMRMRRVVATAFPRLTADSISSFDVIYDLVAGGRTIHARMQWVTIRYDRAVLRLTVVAGADAVSHSAVTDLVRILARLHARSR